MDEIRSNRDVRRRRGRGDGDDGVGTYRTGLIAREPTRIVRHRDFANFGSSRRQFFAIIFKFLIFYARAIL